MAPPTPTRSKIKKQDKEDAKDGSRNSSEAGATHLNSADDTSKSEQSGNSTTTTTTSLTTTVPDVAEIISKELPNANLSGDILSVVNIICKVIQTQFDTFLTKLDSLYTAKDQQVVNLEAKVTALESKITQLENTIDDVDQYERRDTVIISGLSLPEESTQENPSDLIVNTIKQNLHVNFSHSDINVAHRLGPKAQGKKRPIIVKLNNRTKKSELVQACITLKPPLHINESLTPKRRSIYSVIRKIRAQHRHLFQQCYTSDGKSIVKLKSSTVKHTITSEQSLASFFR